MAGDGAPSMPGWNIKNGWYPRGQPVTAPISLSRQRSRSIGAPGDDVPCCVFHGKANSGAYCDFLGRLRRKFGRVQLFPDSAPCHKSKAVREYLEKANGDIQIRYFPPYTPEPSPAGGQWRLVKKATANTLYENTDDMADAIRTTMMSGEIAIAKLSRYLTL